MAVGRWGEREAVGVGEGFGEARGRERGNNFASAQVMRVGFRFVRAEHSERFRAVHQHIAFASVQTLPEGLKILAELFHRDDFHSVSECTLARVEKSREITSFSGFILVF